MVHERLVNLAKAGAELDFDEGVQLLAAHRGGIKTVLIPEDNVKDLQDIPENVKNNLEIVPVRWIERALEISLETMPAALPEEDLASKVDGKKAEVYFNPVTASIVKQEIGG